MKVLPCVLTAFLFLSCGENQKPASANPRPTLRTDSNPLRKEAANPYVAVDVSPMDMLYFPTDYAVKKTAGEAAASPVMRVIYSRPHRGGRQLFGNLVKWNQPWRLGANEATEIEFFQPVSIQGKRIEQGRYVLYAIPAKDSWRLVLNNNIHSWGLKFNPADDVASFAVPTKATPSLVEYFTMTFERTTSGADLLAAWENTEVRLPIQF